MDGKLTPIRIMIVIFILGLVAVGHYTVLCCTTAETVLAALAQEERCDAGYYWHNGCKPCPSNCSLCLSDTNCTSCTPKHYGLACETKCECEEACQKKFGFCTFGCTDGEYNTKEDRTCRSCPEDCRVCSSTHCWDGVCQQCPDCGIGILGSLGIGSLIINVILGLLLWCSWTKGLKDVLKGHLDKIKGQKKRNHNSDKSEGSGEKLTKNIN